MILELRITCHTSYYRTPGIHVPVFFMNGCARPRQMREYVTCVTSSFFGRSIVQSHMELESVSENGSVSVMCASTMPVGLLYIMILLTMTLTLKYFNYLRGINPSSRQLSIGRYKNEPQLYQSGRDSRHKSQRGLVFTDAINKYSISCYLINHGEIRQSVIGYAGEKLLLWRVQTIPIKFAGKKSFRCNHTMLTLRTLQDNFVKDYNTLNYIGTKLGLSELLSTIFPCLNNRLTNKSCYTFVKCYNYAVLKYYMDLYIYAFMNHSISHITDV